MKKYLKIISVISILAVMILTLVGCGTKKVDVKFEGEEGTIVFNLEEEGNYKISTNKEDFRTTRNQAILLGDDFKIGIEFNDDFYGYYGYKNFDEIKEESKDKEEYKEVTYSNYNGLQYFYSSYNTYRIILPVTDNYVVVLDVLGNEDTESAAKEAINSEKVQNVLNSITQLTAVK